MPDVCLRVPQLKAEPSHREGLQLLAKLKERLGRERKMFGGLFERAQGDGGDASGLYSKVALEEEARKKKEEKDRLCKLENLAKLPPDMWADTFKDIEPEQFAKLQPEGKELARQMPDGAWAKAAANLTPEAIQEAKEAVELHKAREELKKAGLLPEVCDAMPHAPAQPEPRGSLPPVWKRATLTVVLRRVQDDDEEDEDPNSWENKLDRIITKVAMVIAAIMALVAVAVVGAHGTGYSIAN